MFVKTKRMHENQDTRVDNIRCTKTFKNGKVF